MLRNRHARRLAVFVSTALMTSGLAIVTGQAPASAAPCRVSAQNNPNPPYATGYCTGTNKYYRVIADCEENSGRIYTIYGNFTWGGSTSRANCTTNGVVHDPYIDIAA